MTHEQFINSIKKTFEIGLELVECKNMDYGGPTNSFQNFESAAVIGLDVKDAILVRTLDKLSRIGNLVRRKAAVTDETVEDSIIDAINYLAILKARLEFERTLDKKETTE